jgi:adenylate kinase
MYPLSKPKRIIACAQLNSGYSEDKIAENVQAEIMMVVAEEARSSYPADVVQELLSNTIDELESNVTRVGQWAEAWIANNAQS